MDDLYVHKEYLFSPTIDFSYDEARCLIEGYSVMENSVDFYLVPTQWVCDFLRNAERVLTIDIKLNYINTSSLRSILDLLNEAKRSLLLEENLIINWFYQEEDIFEIKNEGEDIADILNIPINFIPYS